jgi:hypothetical protein
VITTLSSSLIVITGTLVVVQFFIIENTNLSQLAILLQASVANQAISHQFFKVPIASVAHQKLIAPNLSPLAIAAQSSVYKFTNAHQVEELAAVEVICIVFVVFELCTSILEVWTV